MTISNDYGYPLVRHVNDLGFIEWYYPEVPTFFQPDRVPTLVKGTPIAHTVDDYHVCTFQPDDRSRMVIVLSVRKSP